MHPLGAADDRRSALGEAFAALGEVLRNPGIRRIEIAWAAGIAGDGAVLVALLVAAFRDGGAFAVGVLSVLRMAPSILAAPFAGVPFARVHPGRQLLIAHLVRALAAVGVTLVLVVEGSVAALFVMAAISATAGAFVRPLQSAAMPSLARTPGELVAANVATSTGEGFGAFAGPLAAGVAVATLGPTFAAGLGSAFLLVAAAALVRLPLSADDVAEHLAQVESITAQRSQGGRSRPWSAIAEGPAALRRAPGAATIFLDFGGQVFVRGLSTTLTVVAAIELLGLGDAGVGLLGAASGFGGFVGALGAVGLAGRRRLGPVFAVALSLWGLPLAVIGAIPVPAVAFLALFTSGVANAVLDVAGFTLLQRGIPTRSRTAVFGLLEAMVSSGVAIGGIAAPVLLVAVGDRGALAVAGAILPILAVATWPRVSRVDDEALVPERELAILRGLPLFTRLPMTAIERLAGAVTTVAYEAGETIMREGEAGDSYLIIADGEVTVTTAGREINRCGPGEGIGEIALLHAMPRTATVTTTRPTTGLYLGSADFLAAIAGPTSAAVARRVADERLSRSRD